MLERLARFCYRRRWVVVGAWIALLIGLSAISAMAAGETSDEFSLPDSESQQAFDLLGESGFVERSGEQIQIVFQAPGGVADPAVRTAMEAMFTAVAADVPEVAVVSPYSPDGARQISGDGTIAYAEVNLSDRDADARDNAADRVEQLRDDAERASADVSVALGGDIFAIRGAEEAESGVPTELIGVLAAIAILLIAFGSVVLMGLPITVGLFGAGTGIAVLGLTANLIDMPSFASAAAAMIAIGVGIDYALLVVTRYRESLLAGQEPADAVVTSLTTAGRSVIFAGVTVVIGVLGLVFMNLGLISGVAVGISAAVLMTMLASVTLLPALLGFVGRNVDKLGLPHAKRGHDDSNTLSRRWSRTVQRRPALYGGAALLLLVVLAVPAFQIRLGFGDAGNLSEKATAREAYDWLSEGFGPGFNGPLMIAAEVGGDAGAAAVRALPAAITATDNVAFASPAQFNEAGDVAVIQVVPKTSPQDKETADLVHALRDDVVPAALGGSGATAYVGGVTAAAIDYAEYTGDRLPLFVGVVLAVSFLLVMVVFRSLLVPLKAILMNVLTVGATFGALVAVFQWGWGLGVLGIDKAGPVEAWGPMMMFAVVFGLSMDYEVFLVSRIKEEFDRTGDSSFAVAEGVARTSRVISAAAAIMVCVFGSFIFGGERGLAMFGFGLAFSILIDATVVRLVLVPSVMQLLGPRNWWLPAPLARILPTMTIEGPAHAPAATSAVSAVPSPTTASSFESTGERDQSTLAGRE